MTIIRWSQEKNEKRRQERGDILDYLEHPNQRMMIICINNYAFLVPYVNSPPGLFLNTIIPSRKATKKYLGESNND